MPSSPTVVSGSVALVQVGNKLSLMQSSETAVIEWDDFILDAEEEFKIFLPEEASVLNRVKGAARIEGSVACNGDLYLVSPKGISIGKSGQIYSGRLFASTLSLFDQEYLAGSSLLYFYQSSGGIEHLGRIETYEGSLFFLAPSLYIEGSL